LISYSNPNLYFGVPSILVGGFNHLEQYYPISMGRIIPAIPNNHPKNITTGWWLTYPSEN
jgi:hypothetical protein